MELQPGTASLVVAGDDSDRHGASTGYAPIGSGTATVNPDDSGKIDADLVGSGVESMRLQGYRNCPRRDGGTPRP